jgi:hypothetical protein
VVGVDVARGAVVGEAVVVGTDVVGEMVVTTEGVEAGTVVAGPGTSVKITSWVGAPVAGEAVAAGLVDGVAERADGVAVTRRATAAVLDVVELIPIRSVGVEASPAAKRLPANVVEVVGTTLRAVTLGRRALARRPVRSASPDVTALTRATTMAPTRRATTMLRRVVLLLAYHHSRRGSCAGGRPKAAFLPMDREKR